MGILDYFRPVSLWSMEKVRDFLREQNPDDYNLIDVRQLNEYEEGHLPGAKLIPVGDLHERLNELYRDKPTITY